MSPEFVYETRMQVRDYECDIEGIVNNANYLHYAEHTRHLFLKERGLSFAEMHQKGVDAVVARMNLQFKTPLQCDDEFISKIAVEKEGIKLVLVPLEGCGEGAPCACKVVVRYLTNHGRSELVTYRRDRGVFCTAHVRVPSFDVGRNLRPFAPAGGDCW